MRAVSKGVNGPLIELLAKRIHFKVPQVGNVFRRGGPIVGRLSSETTCVGDSACKAQARIKSQCSAQNKKLIGSLREDCHASFLVEQMYKDAQLGRMTQPCLVSDVDIAEVLLSRRFSCEQGDRPDGSKKIGCIDDASANGCHKCLTLV